jgi:hypothetical protein
LLYTNDTAASTIHANASNNPILEYALVWASHGWDVFPVPPGTKKSHSSAKFAVEGKRWGATKNADIIRDYWGKWPDANLGIPTGAENGFFVVEFDTPEGHGADGAASLAALAAEHGPLPPTREAESPSGSVHYYFQHPGFFVKNSASEVGPGIDVRGDGGMVLAPPSVKPGVGCYKWRNDLALAEAPGWLLDLVKEAPEAERPAAPPVVIPALGDGASRVEKALHIERAKVAQALAGRRNVQLNTSALILGKHVGAGELDEAAAIAALLSACEANRSLVDDGVDQCRATIASGLRKGKSEPANTVSSMFGAAVAASLAPPSSDGAQTVQFPTGARGPQTAEEMAAIEEDEAKLTQISLADFVAYLPANEFIYLPTRVVWPGATINSTIGSVEVGTHEVKNDKGEMETKPLKIRATDWLNRNRGVASLTWAPGHPMLMSDTTAAESGWINAPGKTTFNQYVEQTIERRDGDASPWTDHVRKVFPGDADHIIAWCAHRVQFPQQKINHGLLLGGTQGIGKDTILEPVTHAVGMWNFKEINPDQLLGQFNSFVKCVILRVNEARNLGDQTRVEFYEKTKTLTAAPPAMLHVNEKYMKPFYVPNVCAMVLTTNHMDGLFLPSDDRRFYVAWSNLRKEDFAPTYWKNLYSWFEDGGNEIVAGYLASLDLSGFDAKGPPRKTSAWQRMANTSRAPEDAELADAIEKLHDPDVITIEQVKSRAEISLLDYFRDKKNSRNVSKRFEACGYVAVDNTDAKDRLWRIGGKRQVVYAKASLSEREQMIAARRIGLPLPPPPY